MTLTPAERAPYEAEWLTFQTGQAKVCVVTTAGLEGVAQLPGADWLPSAFLTADGA